MHLYHNVLVAIDEACRLNNGLPSFWAALFDELGFARGDAVIHIGIATGTGYCTVILAQIVGTSGQVTGVEIDEGLAMRSRENIAALPQATLLAANGFTFAPSKPIDAIIVNAGVSHLSLAWLDGLAKNGRLLVPLTVGTRGAFLLITRQGESTRMPGSLRGNRRNPIPYRYQPAVSNRVNAEPAHRCGPQIVGA